MRMPFKELNEVFDADPRSTGFAIRESDEFHDKTIEDHYREVREIRLSDSVPKEIRWEFDTIKNLYLYSWYVFDFTVPVFLYVYALIEKAIKEKCGRSGVTVDDHMGLKKLLKVCINKKWLVDTDFESITRARETRHILDEEQSTIVPKLLPCNEPNNVEYCNRLLDSLPKLRNMAVHGESGLHFPQTALMSILRCACIMNALFRDKERFESNRH